MVIWRNVIKHIFKASLPTVIIPAIVMGLIIKFFGISIDSLLALIFLGQFYIIWAQLEVAMRQTRLSTLEYEPQFKIEIKKKTSKFETDKGIPQIYDVTLRNVGKHLAQNIYWSVNATPQYLGINKPEDKVVHSGNIAPEDIMDVSSFNEDVFKNSRITIELIYENILGESGSVTFTKVPEFSEFMVAVFVRKMPGILLNSFEKISSTLQVAILERKLGITLKEQNK